MTEEEKRLLFQDLVARLPYTPMVNLCGKAGYDRKLVSVHRYNTRSEFEIVVNSDDDEDYMPHNFEIDIVKPYLRPMSSMTEEEALKVVELRVCNPKDVLSVSVEQDCISVEIDDGVAGSETYTIWFNEIVTSIELVDWLNAHHFDYRGLIEMRLALEAPEGMYEIK